MNGYHIYKTEGKIYDRYDVYVRGNISYCYYAKAGNQYATKVYIFLFNEMIIDSFLDNRIYIFSRNIEIIKGLIKILDQEFFNLKYEFIIQDDTDRNLVRDIIKEYGGDEKILSYKEYMDFVQCKKQEEALKLENQSKFMKKNQKDEVGIQKKGKIDGVDRTFADYNGFNEQLIQRNVRNIVQIKRNSGGDRNE